MLNKLVLANSASVDNYMENSTLQPNSFCLLTPVCFTWFPLQLQKSSIMLPCCAPIQIRWGGIEASKFCSCGVTGMDVGVSGIVRSC